MLGKDKSKSNFDVKYLKNWNYWCVDARWLRKWKLLLQTFALTRVNKRKTKLCENMWNYEDQKVNLLLQTVAELGVVIFNALDFGLKVIWSVIQPCLIMFGSILSYIISTLAWLIIYPTMSYPVSSYLFLYRLFLQGGWGAPTESCSWEYHWHDDIVRWE